MTTRQQSELKAIYNRLIKLSQSWALKKDYDSGLARELRRQAIMINHAGYLKNIPAYRKLAWEEGCGETVDIPTIKNKLMSTDDIFKSYNQEWLDSQDFSRMNTWLSGIFFRTINADVRGIRSIDEWITRLETSGVHMSYSSGTSGNLSFVPRDPANWAQVKTANTNYLAPLLTYRKPEILLACDLLGPALRLLSPDSFARLVNKAGLHDFDAVFLGFRRGMTGTQSIMQELKPAFRRHCFLYDFDLTATTLRCLRRGAQNPEEQKLVDNFQTEILGKRQENYFKIIDSIKESINQGQKLFILGAPAQFAELCEFMVLRKLKLVLKRGSLILFGGGWKSFSGAVLSHESLAGILTETFALSPDRILEGYSMTEISLLTIRCEAGRFHLPPILEPVIYDEALSPLEGPDLKGTFGFLDPLAFSYPGFIISGDYVRMLDGECSCGIRGPAITEISRRQNREVKGCGGIMASITA